MSIVNAMADPREFFEQRESDLSLLPPVGLVLLVTAISGVTSFYTVQATMSAMSAEMEGLAAFVYGSAVVVGVVGSLVVWVVLAAVFHGIAKLLYDGDGSFSDTLAVTGWGYGPKVFGALVGFAVTYYVFAVQGVTFPDVTNQQAVQQYAQSIQNRPLFLVSSGASVLFTLWSGYIWSAGISEVQNIEFREAAVAVGIPVALSILWTLFNAL